MRQYLKELTDAFQMVHWTLNDTIAQDDRVVGVGVTAWTHKASGQTVETPVVVICRFRGTGSANIRNSTTRPPLLP